MLNRLYEPDSGEIYLFGKNVKEQNPVNCAVKSAMLFSRSGYFRI
jgi:ABC-type proline/glycine betaine transport system ATPase subunit